MKAEMANRAEVLKYSPKLFVTGKLGTPNSRATDLVYFSDFLRSKKDKLFQVRGPKGSGKSWLLGEFNSRLSIDFEQDPKSKPFPLMIDLDSTNLKRLPKQLKELGKQISEHEGEGNVILIVDGTGANTQDKYDKTEMVENVLLKPQESNPQFKVVIAQENKLQFPFSTGYLFYPENPLFSRVLKPFNVGDISDQLIRLDKDPKKAADILEITGGLPILTPILAEVEDPLHHLEKRTLKGMLSLLLPDVKGKQKEELIRQLLPLSVPNVFGDGEINALGLNISMRDAAIYSMNILSWQDGAYKMDPILRKVLFLLYHLYDKEGAKAAYSKLIDNYANLLQQRGQIERFHKEFGWLGYQYQRSLDKFNKLGDSTSELNPKSVLNLLLPAND